MEQDIFKEVPRKEIPKLIEIFKCNLESYYPFCQYVEIMEEYNEASITMPSQSLYKYGKEKDSVYLFKAYFDLNEYSYTVFHIFTASNDTSYLEKALSQTERVPWFSSNYVFQATLKRYAPVIRKVSEAKGIKLCGAEEDLLWLPPEHNLEDGDVPDYLNLKYLDQSHGEVMDKQWKFKFNGSSLYLGIQITNNFGMGLFRKSDEKMVCSAVCYNSGGIFCLFTDPESRGRGYAELLVRRMSKELRFRRKIPFATVQRENIPSQRVFRKIGFTVFSKMEFISPPGYYKEYKPISVEDS